MLEEGPRSAASSGACGCSGCATLRTIYTAANVADALTALDAFEALWGRRFPMIGKSWRARWSEGSPFLDYPPEIRKAKSEPLKPVNYAREAALKAISAQASRTKAK